MLNVTDRLGKIRSRLGDGSYQLYGKSSVNGSSGDKNKIVVS